MSLGKYSLIRFFKSTVTRQYQKRSLPGNPWACKDAENKN